MGQIDDYDAKYREILQMTNCLKREYKRPIIIFSAFIIPEDVQEELKSAGADQVSVWGLSHWINSERRF